MRDRETYQRVYDELSDFNDWDAETVELSFDQTIIASRPKGTHYTVDAEVTFKRLPEGIPSFSSRELPHFLSEGQEESTELAEGEARAEFRLRDTLGEGAMGIVFRAEQTPLEREVAIKSIRAEYQSDGAVKAFLREARITGLLEHPNIVPIYALGKDSDGIPMLVMKKISGNSWRELIQQKKYCSMAPSRSKDRLAVQIRILMQVCNAIHFAHSKNIVHRDLKPDNVMVGDFGEVYVLDWGIAMQITGLKAPSSKEKKRSISGTPSYMSPEQASGDDALVTERTDVYLLGTLLHEMLVGQPPHQGDTLFDVLYQAFASKPFDYPSSVPNDLAKICHKAMNVNPAERYASADEMRSALVDFLQHRDSELIAKEAMQRFEMLREMGHQHLEKFSDGDLAGLHSVEQEQEDVKIHTLFGQARFGLQQALKTWEGNKQALEGLQQLLEFMIDYELRHGDYKAASALSAELPKTNPDLLLRLSILRTELEQQDAELNRLRDFKNENDLEVGKEPRSIFAFVLAMVWGLFPSIMGLLEMLGLFKISHEKTLAMILLFGITTTVFSLVFRKIMLANRVNRSLLMSMMVMFFILLIHELIAVRYAIPTEVTSAFAACLYFLAVSLLSITIDKRMMFSAGCYLIAIVDIFIFPSATTFILGVGNVCALTIIAFVWNPNLLNENHLLNFKKGIIKAHQHHTHQHQHTSP